MTANDSMDLTLVLMGALHFVHPLLAAPYLPPQAAYMLLTAQAVTIQWEEQMEPFLTCTKADLLPYFLSDADLLMIELADHATVRRKRLLQQMVPKVA